MRKSKDNHIASHIAQHEANTRASGFLRVPAEFAGRIDQYYSKRSGLIILEGPKGPMLAHYTGKELPDPTRHKFHVNYSRDYAVFEGNRVPEEVMADVRAVCLPISRIAETRQTLASGAIPDLGNAEYGAEEIVLLPPRPPQSGPVSPSGIRYTHNQVELATEGGGGLLIDRHGATLSGKLEVRQPTGRGITAESPLWGTVPKTAVTFWAADNLPDVALIQKLVNYAVTLAKAGLAVAALVRLIESIPDTNDN